MPRSFDTALEGAGAYSGKAYFFRGEHHAGYDWTSGAVDAPSPIYNWWLPADFRTGLRAALNGAGKYDGKAYFFKDTRYVRYDWAAGKGDAGYPGSLSAWNLPADFSTGIDAALNGAGPYAGKAYFFKDAQYVRYDWSAETVDAGFPQPLSAWSLPGDFSTGIDAAINGAGPYAGKAYFFKGDSYVRYDWNAGVIDPGFPQPLSAWNLPPEFLSPPTGRNRVWFVSIDPYDQFAIKDYGHVPNIERLRDVAAGWNGGLRLAPIWMPYVDAGLLSDPSLLALFLGGSWAEWREAGSNPAWLAQLDAFGSVLKETRVPILAVCGSHQLVARTFADWSALGHMARVSGGETVPTIAAELADGASRIPNPRLGEVGVFPMTIRPDRAGDPIFKGMTSPVYFMLHHADQVIEAARSSAFVALADPDAGHAPIQDRNTRAEHAPVEDARDRCQVQALKLDSDSRVLYTTQFHPELACANVAGEAQPTDAELATWLRADADGRQLILNFLDLARAMNSP